MVQQKQKSICLIFHLTQMQLMSQGMHGVRHLILHPKYDWLIISWQGIFLFSYSDSYGVWCLVYYIVQDHGLYPKERVEEQPRPPVKANDYSSSSESSESSEESESGEGQEEESPTDRYGRKDFVCKALMSIF